VPRILPLCDDVGTVQRPTGKILSKKGITNALRRRIKPCVRVATTAQSAFIVVVRAYRNWRARESSINHPFAFFCL
jgi:hypothetical protein